MYCLPEFIYTILSHELPVSLPDCRFSLFEVVQYTGKEDSDMTRPVDPDSGFRIKIHDKGGHRYAGTQPVFTDPAARRKKYRQLQ